MEKTDIAIIGAGVVGLAIAQKLAATGKSVVVCEKNQRFGQETSSRNSEVIHSGLYYPQNTLKASLCVKGNTLLYNYCKTHSIKFANTGKILVATSDEEIAEVEKLKENGIRNGLEGLKMLSQTEVNVLEPSVFAKAALLIPSTGIIDTHALMQSFVNKATASGALISYNSTVTAIKKLLNGYELTINNNDYTFNSEVIINCAGLGADRIASLCGLDLDKNAYRLYPCKGDYFRTSQAFNIKRLVYPVPSHNVHNLGIHLTIDLAGGKRFGPDAYYVAETNDYAVDSSKAELFYASIKKYLPSIEPESLFADTSGIRPKLQGPKDGFRDFIIKNEKDKGLEGLVNLIGIESPGLTSCLAIADFCAQII